MKLLKMAFTAFAFVALSMSFGSCKKDWTCECTYNGSAPSSTVIKDKTKKDAEAACTGTASVGGFTVDTGADCSLK